MSAISSNPSMEQRRDLLRASVPIAFILQIWTITCITTLGISLNAYGSELLMKRKLIFVNITHTDVDSAD